MRFLGLFIITATVLCCGIDAGAAMFVKGSKYLDGIYSYLVKPSGGSFKGDVGKQVLSFKDGALMDGRYTEARAVGLAHRKNDKWCERIYFDLGAMADIRVINVRSRVFPGKYIARHFIKYCEIAVSTNGKVFDVIKRGNAVRKKLKKWNEYQLAYNKKKLPARYIRIDVYIPGWNSAQVTEVDIHASNMSGKPAPDAKMLKRIMEQQNSGPLVDRYGQFCRMDWGGKIHSDKQLKNEYLASMEETPEYVRNPKTHDRFGGDKTLGIKRPVTNKFRIEKINGKWWFITPDGYPFIMIGVDAMNLDQAINTVIYPDNPGIRKRFKWLPDESDKTYQSCWKKALGNIIRFDFAKANFIRIHGCKEVQDIFLRDAIKRIRYWGFNSLGKWTQPETVERLRKLKLDIPFILVLNIKSKMSEYNKVPDMFDPAFGPAVENAVKEAAEKFGNYPYYIGFTIANEEWWDHRSTKALLKAKGTYAKNVFIEMVMNKYGSIAGLNRALGSSFTNKDDLNNTDLNKYKKALEPIISGFIMAASKKYYSTWAKARNNHDAKRLILGSSFVVVGMWHVCGEWIRGSIPYSDVMLCDNHNLDPNEVYKAYIKPYVIPANKPVMNGESSFCTTGYGFKYFKTCCNSQKDRGIAYKRYNEKLYAMPEWLGTMYFVYRDQPTGGRNLDGGGESFNMGLVNNCHLPYQDFVKEVKKTNKRLYHLHSGKTRQQN